MSRIDELYLTVTEKQRLALIGFSVLFDKYARFSDAKNCVPKYDLSFNNCICNSNEVKELAQLSSECKDTKFYDALLEILYIKLLNMRAPNYKNTDVKKLFQMVDFDCVSPETLRCMTTKMQLELYNSNLDKHINFAYLIYQFYLHGNDMDKQMFKHILGKPSLLDLKKTQFEEMLENL